MSRRGRKPLEGTAEGERSPTIKLTIPAAVLERLRGEAAELGVKATEVARVRLIASYEESPWPALTSNRSKSSKG